MNALKGYLQPASKKSNKKTTFAPPPVELQNTPPRSPNDSGFQTPAGGRLSRPASIYPVGDFRNSPRESVLDIKSDVMVTWLHSQQLERMWGHENDNEGVVLKKQRGDFTCSPATLRGSIFFDQVMAMNVKVSNCQLHHAVELANSCFPVCHDSQHSIHQNILATTHS